MTWRQPRALSSIHPRRMITTSTFFITALADPPARAFVSEILATLGATCVGWCRMTDSPALLPPSFPKRISRWFQRTCLAQPHMIATPSVPMAGTAFGRAERSLRPRVTMSQVVTLGAVQHTAFIGAHSGRLPGALARLVGGTVSLK